MKASDVTGPAANVALAATSPAAYTASINPSTGGNWLAFAGPSTGVTPSTLAVQVVNYGGLAPGSYSANVVITPTAGGQATVVPVTLTVVSGALIRPAPATVDFVLNTGAAAATQRLELQTTGGAVSYTAAAYSVSGGNWLSISKTIGLAPDALVVTANPTGLPIGNYRGFISIVPVNPAGATQTVDVTLTVAAPPSVAVTPPALTFSYDAHVGTPAPSDRSRIQPGGPDVLVRVEQLSVAATLSRPGLHPGCGVRLHRRCESSSRSLLGGDHLRFARKRRGGSRAGVPVRSSCTGPQDDCNHQRREFPTRSGRPRRDRHRLRRESGPGGSRHLHDECCGHHRHPNCRRSGCCSTV